jgi:hypothetical protein
MSQCHSFVTQCDLNSESQSKASKVARHSSVQSEKKKSILVPVFSSSLHAKSIYLQQAHYKHILLAVVVFPFLP